MWKIDKSMRQKDNVIRECNTMGASITVEAAYVMPIVIFTIFAIIYLAFYLHDNCRIQGIMDLTLNKAGMNVKHEGNIATGEVAYEKINDRSVFYLIFGNTQDEETQIQNILKQELSKGLFLAKVHDIQVKDDKFKIKVTIEADTKVSLPGISNLFIKLSEIKMTGEYPVHNPAETIRRIEVILDTGSRIKGVDKLKEKLEKITGTK